HASPSPSDEVAAALETLERVHADIARDKAGAETVILRQQHDIQDLLAEAEKRDAQIDAMQADIDEMRLALSSERNRLQELEKQSRAHE
ncbi:hypothetical protein, partial [Klebsiella pneumoniae]|uniref:hypothetical protein n=1 Tax=Klebsiella pneumoniae TaxID=573 RepID=UPI0013D3ECE2